MLAKSYKELLMWQKSMHLVKRTYEVTQVFPRSEVYGLTSQIRRSVVSIPSNIAEGYLRMSKKDFRKFLRIAYGSSGELETQLEICRMPKYCDESDVDELTNLVNEIQKMLNSFTNRMKI